MLSFLFFGTGDKAAAWPLQCIIGVLLLAGLTNCGVPLAWHPKPEQSSPEVTRLRASDSPAEAPSRNIAPGDTLRYGYRMPAAGALHALVIFARFESDDTPMPLWEEHPDPDHPARVPDWMHRFISPTVEDARAQNRYENLTLYFDQASLGQFAFTGTAAYVSVPDSLYGGTYAAANRHVIQSLLGDGAAQPSRLEQPFDAFDRWRMPAASLHIHEPDGAFDYVIIIYRRPVRSAHPFGARWNGIAALGAGIIAVADGYRINASWSAGNGQTLTFTGTEQAVGYLIHEIGHHLLGSSHLYIGASGTHPAYWGLFHTYLANQSINAWEREMLGWQRMQRIALPENGITEITLRDYYTTGDTAVFGRPDGSLLIFENRQKKQQLAGGPGTHDLATTNPNDRGLFMYELIPPYSRRIHNIRTFPASGHHLWELAGTSDACGSGRPQPVFRRTGEHPNGISYRDVFHVETEDSVLVAGNPYALYLYKNRDPERCITYTRGEHFATAFGPASQSGKTLFTPYTNPGSLDRAGHYTGLSAYLPDPPDAEGQLRILFSADPFFAAYPELLAVGQHLFFTENTRIPAQARLRLQPGAELHLSPEVTLHIEGHITLPDGGLLTGTWTAAQLTARYPEIVRLLPGLPETVTRASYGIP